MFIFTLRNKTSEVQYKRFAVQNEEILNGA